MAEVWHSAMINDCMFKNFCVICVAVLRQILPPLIMRQWNMFWPYILKQSNKYEVICSIRHTAAHMRLWQHSWVWVMNNHRWIWADNIFDVLFFYQDFIVKQKWLSLPYHTRSLSLFAFLDLFTVLKLSLLKSTNSYWCKGTWGPWSDWWARCCWC